MSSNKSAHLGLHLWEPEDDFLRAEFNENSRRIDDAAGAARYVTLLDVTTTAEAQQVDLDVSGIDFTALWEAELYCDASGSHGSSDLFLIRANGLATGYYRADAGNYVSGSGGTCWAEAPLSGGRSSFQMLTDNPNARAVMSCITGHYGPINSTNAFITYHTLRLAPITWSALKTINIVNEKGTFPAGTRFFMRGMTR